MTITIPDHPKLARKAADAGFVTARDYVVHLIEETVGPFADEGDVSIASNDLNDLPDDEWQRRFDAVRSHSKPCGTAIDYSRESFYPEAGR